MYLDQTPVIRVSGAESVMFVLFLRAGDEALPAQTAAGGAEGPAALLDSSPLVR